MMLNRTKGEISYFCINEKFVESRFDTSASDFLGDFIFFPVDRYPPHRARRAQFNIRRVFQHLPCSDVAPPHLFAPFNRKQPSTTRMDFALLDALVWR